MPAIIGVLRAPQNGRSNLCAGALAEEEQLETNIFQWLGVFRITIQMGMFQEALAAVRPAMA
jgi:hypothetical protein